MNKRYLIGDHEWSVEGRALAEAVGGIDGFKPFAVESALDTDPMVDKPEFTFMEGEECDLPAFQRRLYSFRYEEVEGLFGTMKGGYLLRLLLDGGKPLYLWTSGERSYRVAYLYGDYSVRLLRFALWMGYGLLSVEKRTALIHSSCIVYQRRAILFLGESGTGKSTHTRLWKEFIEGSELLNDDSPVIRADEGQIKVYGSPWSGKTSYYKTDSYPLAACVRLSQAPYNRIRRLNTIQSYAALHPSFPPEFAYDEALYDRVSDLLSTIIRSVPIYHLECLPDRAAAELVSRTLFGSGYETSRE